MAKDLDTRLDELYDLPPAEFIAARDALAKTLSGDERKAVKALRRPSVAAGLANRLARAQPEALQELLEAGEHLRETQLGGEGDVRAAVARERKAVDALVQAARRLDDAGGPGLDRLRALLRAAAANPELQAALERGRVEREPEAGGSWPALSLGAGSPASKQGEARAAPKATSKSAPQAAPKSAGKAGSKSGSKARKAAQADSDEAAVRRAAQERERKRLLAEAEVRHREREKAAAQAEKDADRVRERLESATAATAKAQDALEAAQDAETQAREDAQRALRALKAAQAQLQEAEDDVYAVREAPPS